MLSSQVTGPPSRPTYALIIPKFTCSVPISIGVPCSRHLTASFNDSKGPQAITLQPASSFPRRTSASHSPSGPLLSTGSFTHVAAQARIPDSVLILSLSRPHPIHRHAPPLPPANRFIPTQLSGHHRVFTSTYSQLDFCKSHRLASPVPSLPSSNPFST